jgi:uncharacterized RDD family membrane protein YckC
MPICEQCGTGLPVGHKFCYECGHRVGETRPPVYVDTPAAPAAPAPSGDARGEGWEVAGPPPQLGVSSHPGPGQASPHGAPPHGAPPHGAPPYGAPPYGAPPYGAPPGWSPGPAVPGPWTAGAPGVFAAATPARLVPEGWGRRTLAAIIDAAIAFMLFVVVAAVWLIASGRIDAEGRMSTSGSDPLNPAGLSFGEQMLLTLGLVAGFYLIQVVEEALFSTTLGKLILGLRVVGYDGGRCGLGRALVRNIVKAPAISLSFLFAPAAFLLFLAPVLGDRERRRSAGDRMAHTLVVRRMRAPALSPYGWGGAPPGPGVNGPQSFSGDWQAGPPTPPYGGPQWPVEDSPPVVSTDVTLWTTPADDEPAASPANATTSPSPADDAPPASPADDTPPSDERTGGAV